LGFCEIQYAVQKLLPISQTLDATKEYFKVEFLSDRSRDIEIKGTNMEIKGTNMEIRGTNMEIKGTN